MKKQLQILMTMLMSLTLCCGFNNLNAQPCNPNADFTAADQGNCCWLFTDNTPDMPNATMPMCDFWEIYDSGGNLISSGNSGTSDNYLFCFTASGIYTICNTDCCLDMNGVLQFHNICQVISLTGCGGTPCAPDPTFAIADLGNCCYRFDDLTPNPVPGFGCEHWTIYQSGTVITTGNGSSFTWCFTLSGTYQICFDDCCMNSDGTINTAQSCQTITANCGCCVPYTFNYNVMGCSVCISPLANCPLPDPNTVITVDWGDGSGVTSNFCHTYAISGTYNVCMTSCCINADGTIGNCVTHCKNVTVSCGEPCIPEPYFDFLNWGINQCCVDVVALNPNLCVDPNDPTSVTVDVNGDGQIDAADWQLILDNNCCSFDFGDGSGTVYGPGPHHHCYNQSGYYLICYTACCIGSDGNLYTETICKDAYINCPLCPVDPTFIVTQGINPCCYIFDDLTPDNIISDTFGCNLWEVYDANNIVIASGTGESFTYCFTANGIYSVCNTDCCMNADGTINMQVSCQIIVVDCFCTLDASFALVDLGDCCFQVTGNSCPTIATGVYPFQNDGPCCSLDWGDGSPVVYGAGPHNHCYPNNGVYNICYTTCCVNSDGTITYATSCQQVTANCCCLPEDIITTVNNCTVCVEPVFPTWCVWPTNSYWVEWGGVGTMQGDSCFVYDNPGTYIVCLYACCPSNIYPCDPVGICDTVTVNCCCLPTDFTGELGNCTGTFWPIYNCDGANNIFWDFGDGTTATGNNPTHTFPGTGTYHVCMTACCCPVVNADGTVSDGNCITICQDVYVICDCIDPGLIDPTVFCTTEYDPVCGCDGVTYQNACVAQLNYGVTSWTAGPCPSSDCCLLPGDIIANVNECCVSFGIVEMGCCFIPPNTATYLWNFGDSNTSTLAYPYHCYANSGTYTVTLTSSCADGNVVVLTTTVTVLCVVIGDPCDDHHASFLFEVSELTVHFFETGDTPTGYDLVNLHWSFGDGTSHNGTDDPMHTYDQGGTYTVVLTAMAEDADNADGCEASFTWDVTVEEDCPSDIDGNGFTNVTDLLIFMSDFGTSCP